MKTVLVELTEQEAEIVESALAKEFGYWTDPDNSGGNWTLAENNVNYCESIRAKMSKAYRSQEDALITMKDLHYIVSMAKSEYSRVPSDLHISGKEVEAEYFVPISLANAFLMWLNQNKLLKKLARFDYTDSASKYEEND